jgi:hypothetical protein
MSKVKKGRFEQSLCWSCIKARADRCPWISHQARIWQKARCTTHTVRTKLRNGKPYVKDIEICLVQACDSYVEEVRRSS